jgi:hypothetical protein
MVIRADNNPTYARRRQGIPTPILHDENYNSCITLLDDLENGAFRPEYVILHEFLLADSYHAFEACRAKFNQLDKYDIEKTFFTDLAEKSTGTFGRVQRKSYLYKLKNHYKPF